MEPLMQARRTIVEDLSLFLQIRRRDRSGLEAVLQQTHLTRPAFSLLRALEGETVPGQTLTLQRMQDDLFNPYATRFPLLEQLPLLTEHGYLRQQDGGYRVTETGRILTNEIESAARAYIASLQLPPSIPLPALAAALVERVHRAWQASEPLFKAHQARTQRRLPVEGASALVQIEWAILGLWEVRDDAHMAAWRACRFSGPIFDILSRVWSKEAHTLPGLLTTLEASQWAADVEQGVLQLTQSGYLRTLGDHIELTEHGQTTRDHIEAETDRIFFSSWSHLATNDVIWLAEQLSAVCAPFTARSH